MASYSDERPLIHRIPRESSPLQRGLPRQAFLADDQPWSTNEAGTKHDDEYKAGDVLVKRPMMRLEGGHDTQHSTTTDTAKPSLLRRLTKKLGTVSSGSRHRRLKYASIGEEDHDFVPPDLSHLAGLGYELKENTYQIQPSAFSSTTEDISYQGYDGAEVARRRVPSQKTLGAGLVIGAQIERNHSKLLSETLQLKTTALQRAKTVKLYGQSLAEERKQIIAVDAGVDLSSIEGMKLSKRKSTFADMNIGDTQSYYFPPDPQVPDWRPFSMRLPWMIMLVTLAFALAGIQEWLCQLSLHRQSLSPPAGILSFNNLDDVTVLTFFLWKYFPTMVTIVYSVLYSILDFDIRRLEPYYQLSQAKGARASASLNLDHLTMFQYFVPFAAARLRQWTVFASTIANIMAATVAPALQNPAINLNKNTNPICTNIGCPTAGSEEKLYWVVIDPIWSRLVSVSYIVIGGIGVYLCIQLRRKSGLLSDPVGIAGIASMATKSHILQDFRGLDTATRGEIHKRLAHRTYLLYKSSIWQGEWDPTQEKKHDSERRLKSPHPVLLRLSAGIPFIAILFVVMVGVVLIAVTPARIVANKASWLPILIATVIKLIWSTFEADVRLIEPFYQLSKGNALPQNSITLDYQATVYGWMPIRATLNKHYLVGLVGFVTVCLDVFSVTIGSFSVDSQVFLTRPEFNHETTTGAETYISFWVSLFLSIFILCFAIAVAALVYMRRRHPFLPREPSTIAAVLSFIYASKMLDDFIDTETLRRSAMESRLKNLGKRYGLGWFKGRDGQIHCAIDEEPVVSRYVHGKPYHAAVAGPLQDYWVAHPI